MGLPTTSWTWIWHLAAPEKLKLFIWCIFHYALPTMALLNHRGMAPNSTCPRCQATGETILHCLRDCVPSTVIWHALGFNSNYFLFQVDAITWLREQITKDSVNMFLAGVWWIWRCRNASCLAKTVILANRWESTS